MKFTDLVWENKDCCALHKHARVTTPEGYFQIDVFDDDLYSIAAFNTEGGNIAHPLLVEPVMTALTVDDIDSILEKVS